MHTANDSGATRSTWMDAEVPAFDDPVVSGTRTEVCVIGAGMAGLSVAHELARQGADVIVVDDGPIGGGETARTTAHLSNALDDRYWWLEQRHGADGARLAAASHTAAITAIEETAASLPFDCDFRRVDGYLFAATEHRRDELARELEAARRAGVEVEAVDETPVPFATGPSLRFAAQARFHPIAYLRGLAAGVIERGGAIHTGVHVEAVVGGDPLEIKLRNGARLFAQHVVDATNSTITSPMRTPLRQAPYRSYVIALAVPPGTIADALYWDNGDPYHYLRVARGPDGQELLLVGGADHRTGRDRDPAHRWDELVHWTRARVPEAGALINRWSGQVLEPADGLAFIGRNPDLAGVYLVTGDSGNGLTHAAIAGLVLPALIGGRDHPWAALYDPARSTLRSLPTVVREAIDSALPYADWLARGDVSRIEAIARGTGAVIRRGMHLIATYRDAHGVLHECSARCPHLSGVVSWNDAEKTWDCPCHGSRFDPLGHVLNPPSTRDLGPAPRAVDDRLPERIGPEHARQ